MLDHHAHDGEALTSRVVRMKISLGFLFLPESVLCRFRDITIHTVHVILCGVKS